MNEVELIQEINWQIDKKNKEWIPKNTLAENSFVQKYRPYLYNAFKELGLKEQGWKWPRFVDYATKLPDDYEYLYQRVLQLVLDIMNSYEGFFELKTEEGVYQIPNPLADLNRLDSLFEKYFQTYYGIKNKLHFDLPVEEYHGPIIRGKIKWDQTIKKSTSIFPIEFHSIVRRKEFTTPENILLILCAEWIYKQASRLLTEEYTDPLNESQIKLLEKIIGNAKLILTNFPLPNVLFHSKRYWEMLPDDTRINKLISETEERIAKGLIKNKEYNELLEWIVRFKEQNIWLVNSQTPTQRPLKTRKNLDTMYEAWIFFEFANYFKKSGRLFDVIIQKGERRFDFELGGYRMTFRWEKKFFPPGESTEEDADEKHAWATEAWPDFTVFLEDKIIGVFDAKNYSVGQGDSGPINKILAYMTNLDTNLGVLFFPFKPEYWDELEPKTRRDTIITEIKKNNPNITDNKLEETIGSIKNKKWDSLSAEEKEIFYLQRPRFESTRRHKLDPTRSEIEDPNLTMSLCRLTPSLLPFWANMKEKTIEFVCNELSRRIMIKTHEQYKK